MLYFFPGRLYHDSIAASAGCGGRTTAAALPLDTCFEIIQEGSGQDFDPILAEIFLELRGEIEKVRMGSITAPETP